MITAGSARWPLSPRSTSAGALHAPFATGRLLRGWFFGPESLRLPATLLAGTSVIFGDLVAPVWTLNSLGYTLVGSARAAVILDTLGADNVVVRLRLRDAAHGVMVMLRAGPDGRSGYELGVVVVGGTRMARIRRVVDAQVVDEGGGLLYCPSSADDTPNSGGMNVDVSTLVPAGEEYTIEARLANGTLELRINGASEPTLRHRTDFAYVPATVGSPFTFDPTKALGFAGRTGAGFSAAATSARVLTAETAVLTGVRGERADLLVVIAGTDVWVGRVQGASVAFRLAAVGVFPAGRRVRAVELAGQLWLVGGNKAKAFDPARETVSDYTPTAGMLPGQSAPGVTNADAIALHGTRVVLLDTEQDPQNIWFTAVGAPLDLNTGSDLPGAAFTLAGTRPLKTGQPVTCALQSGASDLVVGTTGGIHIIMGDPALGAFDSRLVTEDAGVAGPDLMVRTAEGVVAALTDAGLILVPVGGGPVNLSRGILGEALRPTALYTTLVLRDPQRARILIVPAAGEAWSLEERLGGADGGWHVWAFDTTRRPTCGVVWRNELVLGGPDGVLRVLDDAAPDDDGVGVAAELTIGPIGDGGGEAMLAKLRVLAARGITGSSGPSLDVRVVGADTAEDLVAGLGRNLLADKAVPGAINGHPATVRAPVLAVVIGRRDTPQTPWRLELAEATLSGSGWRSPTTGGAGGGGVGGVGGVGATP